MTKEENQFIEDFKEVYYDFELQDQHQDTV